MLGLSGNTELCLDWVKGLPAAFAIEMCLDKVQCGSLQDSQTCRLDVHVQWAVMLSVTPPLTSSGLETAPQPAIGDLRTLCRCPAWSQHG